MRRLGKKNLEKYWKKPSRKAIKLASTAGRMKTASTGCIQKTSRTRRQVETQKNACAEGDARKNNENEGTETRSANAMTNLAGKYGTNVGGQKHKKLQWRTRRSFGAVEANVHPLVEAGQIKLGPRADRQGHRQHCPKARQMFSTRINLEGRKGEAGASNIEWRQMLSEGSTDRKISNSLI